MMNINRENLPPSIRSKLENVKFDENGFRIEDWNAYKPIPYYVEPADEAALEKQLQDTEAELTKYKYSEDIPRYVSPKSSA